MEMEHDGASIDVSNTKSDRAKIYLQNRKYIRLKIKVQQLKIQLRKLSVENRKLKEKNKEFDSLSPKMKLIVSQVTQQSAAKSKTEHRYSMEWIIDALLIRCKSTRAYEMLRIAKYLPLPSIDTLNRHIKAMRPEFGFDKTLFECLKTNLVNFPRNERRGILMFDEIQISKNIDFHSDTGKIVGMVDFGEHNTCKDNFTEGDHALVFLFQPHMSGWVQTIGCFCAAGTTPTAILSKLIQ